MHAGVAGERVRKAGRALVHHQVLVGGPAGVAGPRGRGGRRGDEQRDRGDRDGRAWVHNADEHEECIVASSDTASESARSRSCGHRCPSAARRRSRARASGVPRDRVANAADPDGHRADRARRARVRHLLAPARRAHRVPRHADRRPGGEPDRGAAAAPGERGPRKGHLAVHQHARRQHLLGPCDLRHDAFIKPDIARCAWAWRCRWARCCWRRARRASAPRCPTRASSSTSPPRASKGSPTDIEIHAREILKMRERIDPIYAEHTGRPEGGRSARTWSATASSEPSRRRVRHRLTGFWHSH